MSSFAVWQCDGFPLDGYADFLAEQRLKHCQEGEVLAAEDDNGQGNIWCVPVGAYPKDGEGGFRALTDDPPNVPNDELSYVIVPEGMSVYVTDEDTFGTDGLGAQEISGFYYGLVEPDGKVRIVVKR